MSFNRTSRPPAVPTLPKGETIASYDTYLEAQRAVDHLSDKEFAVQNVTIVGTDLRMVERVMGRLTYPRVALAGLASGAWFGVFVGLLLFLFAGAEGAAGVFVLAVTLGAGFGMLFSVVSYSLTGGKRDFTSSSQIVASTYALLCDPEHAHRARGLLNELGGGRPMPGQRSPGQSSTGTQASAGSQPSGPQPPAGGQPTGSQPPGPQPPAGYPPSQGAQPAPAPPSHTPAPHGDPNDPGQRPTSG